MSGESKVNDLKAALEQPPKAAELPPPSKPLPSKDSSQKRFASTGDNVAS